jgi:hypothetical protein
MKFIDEFAQAWRMISMQCMAAAALLQATWVQLPPQVQELVPKDWVAYATGALLLIGMLGRLVKQDIPAPPPAPTDPSR